MAKKVSKFFRIGVEGDTCDGRIISGNDIQEMAESFDPRVYGCRINLEHIRGLFPDGDFKRLGDVVELKAEKIDDDSALNGKWALFARITPTDDLIAMNKKLQKVYTSMEIQPNFASTGKCYLVGLAVTDERGAIEDIKTGRIELAISRCRNIWASLPGAGYGQREHSLDKLVTVWRTAGGVMA